MKASRLLFPAVPIINGVSSLIALPAVSAEYGANGWAAIALGFSIGTTGAVVLEMGWGVDGPLRVARAGERARSTLFTWSLWMRLLLLPVLLLMVCPIAASLSADYSMEAALMGAAALSTGLSPAWYFNGRREPMNIVIADSAPRLLSAVCSALLIGVGGALWLYPALIALAGYASPWIAIVIGRISISAAPRLGRQRFMRLIAIQLTVMRGRMGGSVFKSLPVAIMGLVAPNAVPLFSAAERLQKMVLQFLNSANLFLVGWVGAEITRQNRLRRARRVLVWSVVGGVISGIAFGLFAPLVAEIIFSGTVTLHWTLSFAAGSVIALTCVTRAQVTKLIILRLTKTYSNAAWSGALAGVGTISFLGNLFGPVGGMIGEAVAEMTTIIHQQIGVRRMRRGSS